MLVEVATTDSFRDVTSAAFIDALPESDFTAKALLENLPPDQDIFYRSSFQDLSSAVFGEAQIGHFRTPSKERRSVSFLWSGDTMGQGWGIDLPPPPPPPPPPPRPRPAPLALASPPPVCAARRVAADWLLPHLRHCLGP